MARNRALDRIRAERRWAGRRAALEAELRALGGGEQDEVLVSPVPDERLRLIFTTCHPALSPEARVGLTLRALGGLTTAEVARAFLVSERAMAQRITRATARAGTRPRSPRASGWSRAAGGSAGSARTSSRPRSPPSTRAARTGRGSSGSTTS